MAFPLHGIPALQVGSALRNCLEKVRLKTPSFRDSSGKEIDVVAELGPWLMPIVIKSGQTLNPDYFRGLQRWMTLADDRAREPALVFGGESATRHTGIRVFHWGRVSKVLDASTKA